jgi:sodium/potassium-transporting ATPase subunit alpha
MSDVKRTISGEIVAEATKMRHQANEKPSKGGKDSKLEDAKKELSMVEHQITLPELLTHMGLPADTVTDKTLLKPKGVTQAFGEQRIKEEGANLLTPPPSEPEWKKFMKELFSFFACLLWLGSILCLVNYIIATDMESLYLCVVLAVVVTVTAIFSYLQNRKASKLMDSFKGMMPPRVVTIRDGVSNEMEASKLVRGDIVKLKGGDKVPADLRVLVCSDNCQVDNASLTGESEPQKRTDQFTHENPLETKNLAFFGTSVPQGSMTGMVVNTGDNTVMGRIAFLATATTAEDTPIAKEIHHFVIIVSAIAMVLGITFLIIGFAIDTPPVTNLVFMIGIIVANVPEGLLATVTVCLTLTAKRMAVKKVLVKNLEGVETLGSTTCICSDKTGTLTQNIMTVVKIIYDNKIYDTYPVPNYGEKDASFAKLQRCATLCNNAFFVEDSKTDENGKPIAFKGMKVQGDGSEIEVVQWKTNGDASESAMIKFVHSLRDIEEYRAKNPKCNDGKAEIPFNSANKYQVSVHDTPEGPVVQMKGAPERIINRCDSILIDGEVVPMTAARKAEIEARQMELSKQGLRCLGFCEKVLDKTKYPASYRYNTDNANFPLGSTLTAEDMAKDPKPNPVQAEKMCFLGITALIDPPRPAVPGAVEKCKTAGIKVIMVTGDHPITAKAIAHQVGILWGDTKEDVEEANAERGLSKGEPGWRNPEDQAFAPAIVVPGWTINEDTTEQMWDSILSHKQCVFARTSPQQKLIIVENCQRTGHIVAVTGDGVNDSPALRKADIGIAMGIMGSEVTKDAADMILLDDNFASIVKGVEEGRLIFDNLKKSIAYTLSSNIPEISPFLVFICAGVPLPLTTVLILCVDLGTDMVPAISMAYETAEADIMQRPPRNNKVDRLVTKKLVSFAYLQIGVIQACAGFYTWMVVLNDYGYPPNILPGNGDPGQWGKQPMYCQLEGGEFCNSGLDKDLRCVAAPQPYCRPVLPGHGQQMTDYASLNEDCNIATQTGPCWECSDSNPSGYFQMPTDKVDGVFNCERDSDDYIASLSGFDDQQKAALEAYPGVDWYKRNCFGYNSDMPKDIVGPYPFWRPGAHGDILDCAHAYPNVQPKGSDPPNYPKSYQMSTRNENEDNMNEISGNTDLPAYAFNTAQGYASLLNKGYLPYYPHRARMSPFYHQGWFWASTSDPAHIEVPSSLGKDVAAVILYNFQALNGRWVFAHTGLEFVAASAFATDGSVNTAEPSALDTIKDAADARTQFPLGSTPKWGSVVFAYNQADAGESDNNIGNLVSDDARASGDSDGAGRNNYVPTTNSAASERQDIVTSGWTTTISVAEAPKSCTNTDGSTGTEIRPEVTDANKQFFKVGKQMYKQSFVTTRYYASTIGGFGGETYTGKNTDAATSRCSGTAASSCESKTVPLFNYPFIMTYDKETTDANGATVVNADLSEPKQDADGTGYEVNINKFYPQDSDSSACNAKNTLHHTAVNIFSRMSQKEALHHAQGAFWMCIVVVQWADLLICKTRWLSIREQGMSNQAMNFGLFFETLLAAYLAYWPVLCIAFGTREIRLVHWFTAMPFSLMIFGYDETRKYLMRATSPVTIDKGTGQSIRSPGWLERNTYY